jgi:hypothetical protein
MFCPRWAAENSLEQKYCRRCGLQLSAARISLQGGVGESLKRHKRGELLLSAGAVNLVIFILAALANMFLIPGSLNFGILINLVLGLVIAVPLMAAGLVQLRRAGRTLYPKEEQGQLTAHQTQAAGALSSSNQATGRLLSPSGAPDSVTEQTTLNLKLPEQPG